MLTLADIYAGTGGDKGTVHSYIDVYSEILAPFRDTTRDVVEIGVFRGESLQMWERYFQNAQVFGLDVTEFPYGGLADLRPLIASGAHRILIMNAADKAAVDAHFADRSIDVLIDDASHDLGQQLATYANFRDKMTPQGIYIIEDVQDIDAFRPALERLDPQRRVEILDRRAFKGRYDDVLVVVR